MLSSDSIAVQVLVMPSCNIVILYLKRIIDHRIATLFLTLLPAWTGAVGTSQLSITSIRFKGLPGSHVYVARIDIAGATYGTDSKYMTPLNDPGLWPDQFDCNDVPLLPGSIIQFHQQANQQSSRPAQPPLTRM
eukprot:TRINITY_DN8447_c0_g1_i4.p2 TRINITY_DN8447_c0_g1~~TRINITY_DN8447_c0_g1_i4.p2  ORF type:complete len:134 (+),score=14.54 TRINITY_DN8447_c0_g1_i4:251-652(+)